MASTAERLTYALELRNMKASELHEKTGIGKSSISQYMSGTVKPKQDRIYLMAKTLNVDELWLMGHDVPMERQDRFQNNTPVTSLQDDIDDIFDNHDIRALARKTLTGKSPEEIEKKKKKLKQILEVMFDE